MQIKPKALFTLVNSSELEKMSSALAAEKARADRNQAAFDRLAPSIEYVENIPAGYGEDEIDRLNAQLSAEKAKREEAEQERDKWKSDHSNLSSKLQSAERELSVLREIQKWHIPHPIARPNPYAWIVEVDSQDNSYVVYSEDDAQAIDDLTNSDAKLVKVYAAHDINNLLKNLDSAYRQILSLQSKVHPLKDEHSVKFPRG